MSSFLNIFFPTVRRSVAGVGNPAYVDDIKAANQLLIDGLTALLGMYNADGFLIISGLEYDVNLHTYAPGIYLLDGQFYYQSVTFQEGLYLKPVITPVMPKPFSDTNARPIYENYGSQATSDPTGATPQFNGDMSEFRCGIAENVAALREVEATIGQLRSAAFAPIGLGGVAAYNDPRLVGTSAYFDGRYAKQTDVILKNLAAAPAPPYTPQNAWDPVNKAYADATSGRRLASGTITLGDADTGGGTGRVIDMGTVIPGAQYLILFSIGSLSANHNLEIFFNVTWYQKGQSSFGLWFREAQAGVQNVQLDWIAFAI